MAGANLHFASVSESELLTMQEDAVLENSKKAMKFGLKVFKELKRLSDVPLSRSFRTCPRQSQISSIKTNPAGKSLIIRHCQKLIPQASSAKTSSAFKQVFSELLLEHHSCPVHKV